MALNGYDVSHYQSGLNFWSIATPDFIIAKATEGRSFRDGKFREYIETAEDKDLLIGGYHVLTTDDVDAQVELFSTVISDWDGWILPCVDIEPNYSLTANIVENFVKKFYSKTKVYPWIYINLSMLQNDKLISDYVKKHCAIWLAGYPDNNNVSNFYTINDLPVSYQNVIKNYSFAAWQFTSRFKGNSLDADIAFLSRQQWLDYAIGDNENTISSTKPTTANTTSSVPTGDKWLVARDVINGKYGNGDKRKQALGSRYNEIQSCVNILLTESDTSLANRVIKGEFGNGATRKTILGSRYNNVQAIVNKKM